MDKSTFPDLIYKYNELLKIQSSWSADDSLTIILPSNTFDLYCEALLQHNKGAGPIKFYYDINTTSVTLYMPFGSLTFIRDFNVVK